MTSLTTGNVGKIHKAQVSGSPRSQLINPLIRSYLGKGCMQGQIFQMHPLQWNSAGHNSAFTYVGTTSSKWRIFLWYFNILYTFAYAAFVVVRAYQTLRDETKTDAQKIYMQFAVGYVLFPCGLHMASYYHGADVPAFVRGYMDFMEEFEKEYFAGTGFGSQKIWIRICEFYVMTLYRTINCISVLMVVGMFLRPDSPEHLSSLLQDPQSLSLVQKLPFMLLFGYFEIIFHSHCFIIFPHMTFIMSSMVCLHKLTECTLNGATTSVMVENLERNFHSYHALTILVDSFNQICSRQMVVTLKLGLISFTILGTYCGIRMEGLAALTLGIIGVYCFVLIIVIFALLSEVHTRSSRVLKSWEQTISGIGIVVIRAETCRDLENYAYCKRVLESLRPMKVAMRTSYYVDRDMVKTMIQSVVGETVSFLLANP